MRVRLNKKSMTSDLLKQVQELCGENVWECYQCGNCSAGCPMSSAMDILPNQVIRLLHLGLVEEVFKCRTIWLCASCLTCVSRCPRGVNLAKLNEAIRYLVFQKGKGPDRYGPAEVDKTTRRTAPQQGLTSAYRKFSAP